MTDVNKPKLQLRSTLPMNCDKTPSPATKLLINHGKPNFTIQRSMKVQNGNVSRATQAVAVTSNVQNNNNNNNEFFIKSTTFNGVCKRPNIRAAIKQTVPQSSNSITNNDNEAAKVVLRRTKVVQTEMREGNDDENVPEFIRRQRCIQQRLANQNILDFVNRRSGYFTQVLISPSNPNRKSFAETMESPVVKPGLEIPPPQTHHDHTKEGTISKAQEHEQKQSEFGKNNEINFAESITYNDQIEEEVAKAIEEVNKAVEGEDYDRTELEEQAKSFQKETEQNITFNVVDVATSQRIEKIKSEEDEKNKEKIETLEKAPVEEAVDSVINSAVEVTVQQKNYHADDIFVSMPLVDDEIEDLKTSGLDKIEQIENGHLIAEKLDNDITISHVNGRLNGPSISPPDPKGEKGVNFKPKTVVSFSQELGNDDNKYPDTVKTVKDMKISEADSELKELTNLKFEIKVDSQDIKVKPVIITETA